MSKLQINSVRERFSFRSWLQGGPDFFSIILALVSAMACSSAAYADRLFAIELTSQGRPAVGVTVCLGTDENPSAFGGAVTDEEGRVVLAYPDRGERLRPVTEVVMRTSLPGGQGAIARVAARSEEGPNPQITSLEVGVPVSCGANLPVSAAELLTEEEQGVLRSMRANPAELQVIPRRSDARAYARLLEAAIEAEEENLTRARESGAESGANGRHACFGAVGNACGWFGGRTSAFAFCVPDLLRPTNVVCSVNSGSWQHDECCFQNPNGKWCGGDESEPDQCSAELDRGWDRMRFAPYTWTRSVIAGRTNSTGRVERDRYCAPDGTVLPRDDANYCCSRYRELEVGEWIAFMTLNPLENIGNRDLRICNADGNVVAITLDH